MSSLQGWPCTKSLKCLIEIRIDLRKVVKMYQCKTIFEVRNVDEAEKAEYVLQKSDQKTIRVKQSVNKGEGYTCKARECAVDITLQFSR